MGEAMKIEGMPGDHISHASKRAVEAAAGGEPTVLVFNEIEVPVISGMTAADVAAEYGRKSDARHAAYIATPEYKARVAEGERRNREKRAAYAAAIAASPKKMSLKDPAGWAKAKAANTDDYGGRCISYADEWARLMESAMAQGQTIAGCAKELSHLADYDGITGFMYGAAVSILSKVWTHGKELRRWHNLDMQIKNEGEKANESGGVLNPALLTVGI